MKIQLSVNGVARQSEVEPRMLLVHYLREVLGLTGKPTSVVKQLCVERVRFY